MRLKVPAEFCLTPSRTYFNSSKVRLKENSRKLNSWSETYFNSSKVRLKDSTADQPWREHSYFNSSKVRLKVLCDIGHVPLLAISIPVRCD